MKLDDEAIRCHGILWHQDTQWQLCPRVDTCARYKQRRTGGPMAPHVQRLCNLREFEHYLEEGHETS